MRKLIVVLHVISWPIRLAANGLHRIMPHNKRVSHCIMGIFLMWSGAYLAKHVPEWADHVLWDAISYGLHAFGGAPVIKVIAEILSMEV